MHRSFNQKPTAIISAEQSITCRTTDFNHFTSIKLFLLKDHLNSEIQYFLTAKKDEKESLLLSV